MASLQVASYSPPEDGDTKSAFNDWEALPDQYRWAFGTESGLPPLLADRIKLKVLQLLGSRRIPEDYLSLQSRNAMGTVIDKPSKSVVPPLGETSVPIAPIAPIVPEPASQAPPEPLDPLGLQLTSCDYKEFVSKVGRIEEELNLFEWVTSEDRAKSQHNTQAYVHVTAFDNQDSIISLARLGEIEMDTSGAEAKKFLESLATPGSKRIDRILAVNERHITHETDTHHHVLPLSRQLGNQTLGVYKRGAIEFAYLLYPYSDNPVRLLENATVLKSQELPCGVLKPPNNWGPINQDGGSSPPRRAPRRASRRQRRARP